VTNVVLKSDKSKCLIFHAKHISHLVYEKLQPFVISGNKIECVPRWSYAGHVINTQLSDDDIAARKSHFIRQINGLICIFSKLDSMTRNRLFQVYCSSFFGTCVIQNLLKIFVNLQDGVKYVECGRCLLIQNVMLYI